MTIKITLAMNQNASGWSETYYHTAANLSGVVGPTKSRFGIDTPLLQLIAARRKCLVANAYIAHARCTDIVVGGMLPYTPPATLRQGQYAEKSGSLILSSTEVWTSLIFEMYSGLNRPKRLYLSGIPEDIITQPQLYNPNENWVAGTKPLIDLLIGGSYCWPKRAKVGVNDLPITTFNVQADGLTAIMAPITAPPIARPTWYVLIRGLKNPRGWNGVHRAQLGPGAGTMTIGPEKRPMVSDPAYSANPASTVVLYDPQPAVIDTVVMVKIVNKKRGRPFGLLRGRR